MYVYNMDYEKKYLKYKSKYNLKKNSLKIGGGEIMTGGFIEVIATLVHNDTPMINKPELLGQKPEKAADSKIMYDTIMLSAQMGETLESKGISITPAWSPYIKFIEKDLPGRYKYFKLSFIPPINPNAMNSRNQTLLYLAAQNCNKQMFDALVAMGVNPTVLNSNGSSIFHGIAWGKLAGDQGKIATYDEKTQFMEYILATYPQTVSLLFNRNSAKETYFDNLLMRHPDKISKGLEDVAFPIGYVRQQSRRDGTNYIFYVNTTNDVTTWDRPY